MQESVSRLPLSGNSFLLSPAAPLPAGIRPQLTLHRLRIEVRAGTELLGGGGEFGEGGLDAGEVVSVAVGDTTDEPTDFGPPVSTSRRRPTFAPLPASARSFSPRISRARGTTVVA